MVQSRSNNGMRARARRSVSTEGTESHTSALALINEGVEELVTSLQAQALKGDAQAARTLLGLVSQDFDRSRSGANDPLLQELARIRAAGSSQLEVIWERSARLIAKSEFASSPI